MRKFIFICVVVGAPIYYVSTKISLEKAISWSKARPVAAEREKYLYYAGMYFYLRDMELDAAATFAEILTEDGTGYYEPRALMRMGRCYQNTRRFEEARTAYERYIEHFPAGADIELVKNNYEFVKFR